MTRNENITICRITHTRLQWQKGYASDHAPTSEDWDIVKSEGLEICYEGGNIWYIFDPKNIEVDEF